MPAQNGSRMNVRELTKKKICFLLVLGLLVVIVLKTAFRAGPPLRHIFEPQTLHPSDVLHWDGDPIPKGSPHWQRLDSKGRAFVYSAHYDDMERRPVVRVVGLARSPLPYKSIWCRFHDRQDGAVSRNTSGNLEHFRRKNGYPYMGAFVICPLTDDKVLPFAVALDSGDQSAQPFLVVHYSQKQNLSSVEQNTSNTPRRTKKTSYEWNITRCFPAFFRKYDDHVQLAEMVAASVVMGVDHFVFYVLDVGPSLSRMLQVLKEVGLAEVYTWNLHPQLGEGVHYKAQFSAIQDCLYRHLHASRFLLFGDADELFVPRSRDNLLPLLEEHFAKEPACGAYLFMNVFFDPRLPTKLPPTNNLSRVFIRQNGLPALSHPTRYEKMFAPSIRSKPAVDPRKVLVGSVHVVERFRRGFKSCNIHTADGLLHHYRNASKQEVGVRQTEDPYLWRYTDAIVNETRQLLNRIQDEGL